MKLRAAREASGKTQAQVAKEIGVTLVSYYRYEREYRIPNVYIAKRIARAVNSNTVALWGFGAATPSNTEPDDNQAKQLQKENTTFKTRGQSKGEGGK